MKEVWPVLSFLLFSKLPEAPLTEEKQISTNRPDELVLTAAS